ncbi:MAG: carbon-nitrogen hydrolase family protein [Syntrophomonadaceae bacterium]|nr:carbon-nitrogen hydrolase family protein [Syntrophomonadaceae bacterium]
MKITISVCQMTVTDQKAENLKKAKQMIIQSAQSGADMVILPEIFNGPYQSELFPIYAEKYPGPTTGFLSQMAREYNIGIIGGSIVEKGEDGKLYNCSFAFDHNGQLLGKHRKVHLFDVEIPGELSFRESDTLSPGNQLTVFVYKQIRFGLMICYDVRFPELARLLALSGVQVLVIPAAFNTITGPAHWDLLMRCRAVDNQCYVVAASPARNANASYQAWGYSMAVDPWGKVINQLGQSEAILLTELDIKSVEKVKSELPLLKHRRTDLYKLEFIAEGSK